MYDSAKYLIHADVRASGVVERSDNVAMTIYARP
jgi:hypothetical protein